MYLKFTNSTSVTCLKVNWKDTWYLFLNTSVRFDFVSFEDLSVLKLSNLLFFFVNWLFYVYYKIHKFVFKNSEIES